MGGMGRRSHMIDEDILDLFYFEAKVGNFGDDLNAWIWDELLPGWQGWSETTRLLGVGTLLNARAPQVIDTGKCKLVVGSGVGYGDVPVLQDTGPWDIRAVRGPRSARALGLHEDLGHIDPAMMVAGFERFSSVTPHGDIVFVPHYQTMPRYDWPSICARAGVTLLSPSLPSHEVIAALAGAKAVIAESMHAAIIADAFGVPWRPVEISASFNHFKWLDWAESLKMELPTPVKFYSQLDGVRHVVRQVRRKPAAGVAQPSAPSEMTSDDRFGGRLHPLFAHWAGRTLARVAREDFMMSDRETLKVARQRYSDLLHVVQQDYGP